MTAWDAYVASSALVVVALTLLTVVAIWIDR